MNIDKHIASCLVEVLTASLQELYCAGCNDLQIKVTAKNRHSLETFINEVTEDEDHRDHLLAELQGTENGKKLCLTDTVFMEYLIDQLKGLAK